MPLSTLCLQMSLLQLLNEKNTHSLWRQKSKLFLYVCFRVCSSLLSRIVPFVHFLGSKHFPVITLLLSYFFPSIVVVTYFFPFNTMKLVFFQQCLILAPNPFAFHVRKNVHVPIRSSIDSSLSLSQESIAAKEEEERTLELMSDQSF